MKRCSTCCTHPQTLDFGREPIASHEKLEFVEHVLGVLIESRYGTDLPYTRLGDTSVTIGHSQMFANVRFLTAAEIEAHVNGSPRHVEQTPLHGLHCDLCELCLRKRTFHARDAKDAKDMKRSWDVRFLSPPMRSHADIFGSHLGRGSPTFSGT